MNCLLDACNDLDERCFSLEISNTQNYSLDRNALLNAGDTTLANNYALLLNTEVEDVICRIPSSFGGSLRADQPIFTLQNKVSNISIKSNADLSANYPAGQELIALFSPRRIFLDDPDNTSNPTVIIDDYDSSISNSSLTEVFNRTISQDIFFKSEGDLFVFALISNETIIPNSHQMTFRMDYENGSSVEFTSSAVYIN